MRAIVLDPGEGERLAVGPTAAVYKAAGEDTEGRFAVAEVTLAPGFPGPVLHRHREMHDVFFVLEGTVRFRLGAEQRDLGPGGFVLVPPGVAHTFSNPHAEPGRMLNLFAPAGLEGYLREVMARGVVDPAEMARLASTYDFEPAE
ncbi:MAG: cupin domain-containing protein [Thermoleophilia bacterium]|nr:cupin domain-containing protein [Thermoleophilia bacterium]